MSDVRVPTVNLVMVAGRLCRDPRFRMSLQGTPIADFTIANVRYVKEGAGYREEVAYVPCRCYGGLAEKVQTKFRKGRPVLITGNFDSEVTGSGAGKRTAYFVSANKVEPLSYGPGDAEQAAAEQEHADTALAGFAQGE